MQKEKAAGWRLEVSLWQLAVGSWRSLVAGHLSLVIRHWMLGVGRWMLGVGYWILSPFLTHRCTYESSPARRSSLISHLLIFSLLISHLPNFLIFLVASKYFPNSFCFK